MVFYSLFLYEYPFIHQIDSLLLAGSGKIGYISKQLGHSNIHTTLTIYAKYIPDEDDGKVLEEITEEVTEMLQRSDDSEKVENHNTMISPFNRLL